MGGKSKSQTTGYKYFMGLHMGLCHGPVDALLEIKCGDRTAWSGSATASESIAVNAPKLFGGDEKEGGVVGMVDVMMGEPTQLRNEYLETQTGADRPAYRGLFGLVFRGAKASERSLFGSVIRSILGGMALGGGGHITSNNPYIKPWAVKVRRILQGWKGGTAWYAAKAPVSFNLGALATITDNCNSLADYTLGGLSGCILTDGDVIYNPANQADNSTTATRAVDVPGLRSITFEVRVIAQNLGDAMRLRLLDGSDAEIFQFYPCLEQYQDGGSRKAALQATTGTVGAGHLTVGSWYSVEIDFYSAPGATVTVTKLSDSSVHASQNFPAMSSGDVAKLQFVRDGDTVGSNTPAQTEYRIINMVGSVLSGAMNPAHIVYECLTNSEWGMGYDSSIIDDASFTAAADVFYAEGLGLCLQWLRQDSIENFIKLVMDHAGAVVVEDRTTGLIQLKPLRGDYDIGTLPEFGSELGNVIEMRRFERGAVTDAINEVSVSYTDATTGKTGSVAVQNLAAVQASGRVISQSVDYPGLPTMDLALRTAMRDLRSYTSGLARVHLTVNRSGYSLTPGDVIKFSWLPDGIESMVLRVIDIDYGSLTDGKVMLECLEDVFGLPATTYVAQQTSGWEEPSGTAEASPAVAVFEAPYRELIGVLGRSETQALSDDAGYLRAVAARAPGFNLNYQLYTRISPADYADSGSGDWCPSGTLDADIGPIDTLITLAGAEDIELVEVGGTAMLGSDETAEIVRVDAVDADTGELTIARGCLDTTPKPWPLGTRFWSIDTYSAGSTTEYATAETVDAKMLTRTGSDLLSEASAPGASLTLDQRQVRPYPPGLLRIDDALANDKIYPSVLYGALTVSWAHRDRLLQDDQVIDTLDASIGPEAGTTYTVRYYQPANTLVNTQSAISGDTATAYPFPADGQARITVEALRGGIGSWQLQDHTFSYFTAPNNTRIVKGGDRRITKGGDPRVSRG